ncbi:hypothetical protein [Micromonospora sp. NPDC049274]|uniref:hypothetical protein n=1 Tax=Micromonospora sp. NPDC049274 TaxID=3154829 RepID=UPI0034498FBD
MSVSYPVFLVVVGGMLFAALVAIPTGVLAVRSGVARGVKIVGTMLLPVVGLWAAVGLLRLNPVDGEYRVGPLFVLLGVLGPFAAIYDLRRVRERQREGRVRSEHATQGSADPLWMADKPVDRE